MQPYYVRLAQALSGYAAATLAVRSLAGPDPTLGVAIVGGVGAATFWLPFVLDCGTMLQAELARYLTTPDTERVVLSDWWDAWGQLHQSIAAMVMLVIGLGTVFGLPPLGRLQAVLAGVPAGETLAVVGAGVVVPYASLLLLGALFYKTRLVPDQIVRLRRDT